MRSPGGWQSIIDDTTVTPTLSVAPVSRTSTEIQRGLDEFQLDAGVTYLDNEPLRGVRATPLYTERYILLTPSSGPFAGRSRVTWPG